MTDTEVEVSPQERVDALVKELGLTVETVFVPWSASRSKGDKDPSLNWSVTLKRGDRPILTVDYTEGCAYCPSFKQGDNTQATWDKIKLECEHGHRYCKYGYGPKIAFKLSDFLYSIMSDCDAIEYSGFEEWARTMGDNPDSIKAKKAYDACLDTALKMRHALGDANVQRLREAFQDY